MKKTMTASVLIFLGLALTYGGFEAHKTISTNRAAAVEHCSDEENTTYVLMNGRKYVCEKVRQSDFSK